MDRTNEGSSVKRAKTPWTPTWKEVEGAATNFARRNLWRCRPLYEMEDLMGEAYVVFLRLVKRYPRVVDPPHFMSLFLMSWSRILHSIASRRTRSASGHVAIGGFRQAEETEGTSAIQAVPDPNPAPWSDEQFQARLDKAPAPIRALVEGLERSGRPRRCARFANGTRMTTNQFLCRIAQVDPKTTDLRSQLFAWLESGSV